ncbi:MAG TPA: tetratricopeptide repeat protein [Ignavibacteriaceae bacterium]|nr:tetratricopeptide repeat protein [Ignavibacteriaceae bacterium]
MIKKISIVFLLVSMVPNITLPQETNGSLYYSLGENAMQINNYEEAIKNFKLSIKHNEPEIKKATIEICFCYKTMENFKEAINWGKKALLYDLTVFEKYAVYRAIALSYGYSGDDDNASKYFELIKEFVSDYNIPGEWEFVKDGWYYIADSDYDAIYYNKNTIKKNGKGKIFIWLKWYWDGKGLHEEDWVKIYKNGNDTAVVNQRTNERINEIMQDRENVSYTLKYYEYDFINNHRRLIELIEYDKKGNVLSSINFNNEKVDSEWSNIVPGSIGEKVFITLRQKFYK